MKSHLALALTLVAACAAAPEPSIGELGKEEGQIAPAPLTAAIKGYEVSVYWDGAVLRNPTGTVLLRSPGVLPNQAPTNGDFPLKGDVVGNAVMAIVDQSNAIGAVDHVPSAGKWCYQAYHFRHDLIFVKGSSGCFDVSLGEVRNVSLTAQCDAVVLRWEQPENAPTTSVRIVRKATPDIAGPEDGELVCDACTSPTLDRDRAAGQTWHYKLFTYDATTSVSLSAGVATSGAATAVACPDVTAQKLLASGATAGDHFGMTVAISGDYAVVGAHQTKPEGWDGSQDSAFSKGAAYVFKRINGQWTETAVLRAPDDATDAPNPRFGWSVAIDGDRIVVGTSPCYVPSRCWWDGRAYLFERSNEDWDHVATMKDTNQQDLFGQQVAVAGDWIFVGATDHRAHEIEGVYGPGAVFVYKRTSSGLEEHGYLRWQDDPHFSADFGRALAARGDRLIVASVKGAAIFERTGDDWVRVVRLDETSVQSGGSIGSSVAIDGDTAVVGASGAGAAYVFTRTALGWTESARLTSPDTQTGDAFGNAVGIDQGIIVVAAVQEDGGEGDPLRDAGAAYVFSPGANGYDLVRKLVAPDTQTNDLFGYGVSISGGTVLVGARWEDGGDGDPLTDTGAAYFY